MGSSGSSTTTSTYSPPADVLQNYQNVVGLAQQAQQIPFTPYGGEMVAQLNPTQQAGISNVNQAVGTSAPSYGAALGGTLAAYGGYSPEAYQQGVQGYMSPYLSTAMGSTAAQMENVNQQQQQQLIGNAISQGAFGGDRSGIALANLENQQNLALGQTLGQMAQSGYQNAAQNYLTGLGAQGALASQLGTLGANAQTSALQGAQAQLAAGAQQQATQQALDQANYNQFLQQQAYPFQSTQYLANIVEGIGAGSGGTSTTTSPGPSLASTLFGGLGALSVLSDSRMKDNMKPIGETYDGQKIYKFNYKGDPRTVIGLNAAETEKTKPEAVSKTAEGIRGVNYDVATKDAEHKGHFAEGGVASMGGAVHEGMDRQGFALGGGSLGDIPYIDFSTGISYIPTIKTIGGKSTIPNAPKPYQDTSMQQLQQELAQIKGFGSSGKGLFASGGLFGQGGLLGSGGTMANLANNVLPVGSRFGDTSDLYSSAIGPGLDGVPMANGGVAGDRQNFSDGGVGQNTSQPDIIGTISTAAQNAGIDPSQFVTLGSAESGLDPNAVADDKSSFGLFQMHVGGLSDKYPNRGVGDEYYESKNPDSKASPAERAAWLQKQPLQDQAEFNANYIKQNGANAWTMARNLNLFGAGQKQQRGNLSDVQLQDQGNGGSLLESALGRKLDPDTKMALLTGSLGMMASTSPFFGVALGEGGLAAVSNYMQQKQAEREYALGQQNLGLQQQRIGIESRKTDIDAYGKNVAALQQLKSIQAGRAAAGLPPDPTLEGQINNLMSSIANVTSGPQTLPSPTGALKQTGVSTKQDAATTGDSATLPPLNVLQQGKVASDQTAAVQAQKADDNVVKSTQDPAFLAKLKPENNPQHWYDLAKSVMPYNPEQGQKFLEMGRAADKSLQETGYGFGPNQEIIQVPGWAENQALKGNIENTQKYFDGQADAYSGRQQTRAQLQRVSNLLQTYQSGALAEPLADAVRYARSLGFDVPDSATANPVAFQEFVKEQMKNVFSQIKEIGGQMKVAEMKGLEQATANPTLEPAANRAILGEAFGIMNYADKKYADSVAYRNANRGTFDRSNFELQWNQDPKNNPLNYIREAEKKTPVRGATPQKASDLQSGYQYVIEPNYGPNTTNRPKVFTFNGYDPQKGYAFDPVTGQ